MATLARRIALRVAKDSHHSSLDTCSVSFTGSGDLQFLRNAFIEGMRQSCSVVISGPESLHTASAFELQASRATVQYSNMFRDGLFGEKKVERSIIVEFSVAVSRSRSRELAVAGLEQEVWRDTVPVKILEYLPSPGIRVTYANVPPETFFDRMIEPLVILGTTGILVYLFFTVRS